MVVVVCSSETVEDGLVRPLLLLYRNVVLVVVVDSIVFVVGIRIGIFVRVGGSGSGGCRRREQRSR